MNAVADLPLGIFQNVSNEQYHGRGIGLSNSALTQLAKSPAHYWAMCRSPDRPKREPTPAMRIGTLAHCAILESAELEKRYIVLPDDAPKRPTAAQWSAKKPSPESVEAMAWWTAFEKQAAGREVITPAERAAAETQRQAVVASPELRELLASGVAEQSAYWLDHRTGVRCQCRPDWTHRISASKVILVDVKTTVDASPGAFARSVWDYGYHRQAALYSGGFEAAGGGQVVAFIFATVTNAYPYLSAAYELDEDALRRGADECRRLIDLYAECERTNTWPGFSEQIRLLSLPRWAKETA